VRRGRGEIVVWTGIVLKRGRRVPGTFLLWGQGTFFVICGRIVRCVLFVVFLLAALWLGTRSKTTEAETMTVIEKREE
jgi:hypothetical protein